MHQRTTSRLLMAASLVAVAGLPASVVAQEEGAVQAGSAVPPAGAAPAGTPEPQAGAGEAQPAAAGAGAPAQPADTQPVRIRFNFKDAPLDQVLDFFSRESALPPVREAPVPQGTMTFISAASYTFDEALHILNLNLAGFGVRARAEGGFLYLQKLEDSYRKPGQVVHGAVPGDVPLDEIVTLTIPLNNARAELVAQQIAPLIGPYGKVTPVAAQNLLVLIETAAQCRRIHEIVSAIDEIRDIDSAYRLFPLRHAQADPVFNALKGLLGERQKTVVLDKDGNQRVINEVTVAGLNLQPDARTNSIIAVGAPARIRVVEELISLLDVPEGGAAGEQQMMTFALESIDPAQASQHLNSLFAQVPAGRKPTVLPLPEAGKITVVGPAPLLAQAMTLIGEIDPAADRLDAPRDARPERVAKVVTLSHATPEAALSIASRLLSPRQASAVRMAATPDASGIVVSGPTADVAALEALLAGIDTPPKVDKEVRLVRISTGDPAAVLAKAQALYAATGRAESEPVAASLDGESRTATLVGSSAAIGRFSELLKAAESGVVVDLETRSFELAKARPSVLAPKVLRLARPMLTPGDGSAYAEPVLEPLDELNRLIVRAAPSQFTVLEELIARLDQPQAGDSQFRVVPVGTGDPGQIAERAMTLYRTRAAALPPAEAGTVNVEVDEATGHLVVTGDAPGVRLFTEVLDQVRQLVPPQRTTRLLDVQQADAGQLIGPLMEMLSGAPAADPGRRVPPPTIQVVERTNSLLVTAEASQHEVIAEYVRRLDTLERTSLPPLKLLQVRAADATALAGMLSEQYGKRPQQERSEKPVDIRADAATNTLIVSAHPDLYEEIRQFVDEVNKDRGDGPERVTQLFPLKVAKAADVAAAMDKLYPQPPMPMDRLGRPMPWLQQPKEVTVSAEASSNSLIIDAPADRMESIQELAAKLDRVELPPQARLKTYPIVGQNLDAIARTLTALAARGNLSGPAQPGKPSVQVVIETEPRSGTLIVAGDETTFERVEAVLRDLSAVPVEKGLRVIPIANVSAADVRERAVRIYEAQVAQIPGANPVEVTVDEETNSLMVVADAEAMERFMRVMDELQRQMGPAREVRMIELRFARAEEVVAFLTDLVRSSESFRIRGGPDPVFEPIESTNAVMVAAMPSQMPIVEQIIRGLDNQQTTERPPMRILRLRSTDAPNLAAVLQQAYERRPAEQRAKQPVDIQADAATNTLIVSAHAEVLPEIEAIVSQLNDAQLRDEEEREIRIFPLRVARADELAQTIDQMYPQPPVPLDPRTRQPRPDLQPAREVVVRADRATNSLIVDAPARRLAGFEQLVQALDQQKVAENVELRTYRVARADLNAVAATIRGLAESKALFGSGAAGGGVTAPVTVATEPASRSLIVSGPTEIFAAVEDVLKKVDAAPAAPPTGVRLYPLRHARAERVQPLLRQILTTRLREQQSRDGAWNDDALNLLDVAADNATNTLIVSAPESIQAVAEELIRVLDAEGAAGGRSLIRVVPLTFADAAQVAQSLTSALPMMELPAGGPVRVLPAGGSNALLLAGAEADLKKVEELIAPLDARPSDDETPGVETFALEHADAATIAQTVERLLVVQHETDPRILSLQVRYAAARANLLTRPTIRVEADPRTNSLIVSAPTATLGLARTIIERLDQPAEHRDRTAVTFTPAKGDPAQLAQAVLGLVKATTPPGRSPLELTPEPRTGSIVAVGTAEQVGEAVRLLTELDDRIIEPPAVDLVILDLEHADASGLAATIEAMLNERSRWPEALLAAERAGVAVGRPEVNADVRANRLLISAPTALMPLARELASMLDQPATREAVDVRVFQLRKGDAASVAAAMRAALSASPRAGEPPVTVMPEPGSNSIVVSGSAARLAQAEVLVATMDEAKAPEGLAVRTVYLRHARAESLAPIVERVLQEESVLSLLPEWQRAQFLARADVSRERRVRVAAEKRLNALVISAPTGVMDLAEQMIRELDAAPDGSSGAARGGRAVRVLTLRNSDATELARSIEAVFADESATAEPPTVRVDAQSNSLVVRADAEQMRTIEGLVNELDAATVAVSRQVRMIPVDRSRMDAGLLARQLQRLLEERGGVKVQVISTSELLDRAREPGEDDDDEPDPQGRGPSGAAPPNPSTPDEPAASARREDGSARACGVLPWILASTALGAAEPPESAPGSRGQAQAEGAQPPDDTGEVTIAVDPVSNSLIVVGSQRLTERLTRLAEELQRQMPAEPTKVRIVTLPESASAPALAQVVNQTVQQIGRATPANPGGFSGAVAVAPDPSGGALIVWANDTDFETIGTLIASVAKLRASDRLTVKVYALSSVTAQAAARAVNDLVSPQPRGVQARQARELDLTLELPDGGARAVLDPSLVHVSADPGGASLIVTAPAEAFDLIDRFVALIDQSPVVDRLAIRRYELANADAEELAQTLQQLFEAQRQGPAAQDLPRARFVGDERTNSLLATASDAQHREVERLLVAMDAEQQDPDLETAILTLQNAAPSTVQRVVEEVVIGSDPGKRDRVRVSAEDGSNIFVVRAPKEDIEEIRRIVGEVDTADTAGLPVRAIKLERADAQAVAAALTRFFQERTAASQRIRRGATNRVAVTGDRRSGTLVVAASDEDFAQIQSLVETFDAPAPAREMQFKVIPLRHARVTDIQDTVQNIAFELQYERVWGPWSSGAATRDGEQQDKLFVEVNERTNSVVVMGQGETMRVVEQIIAALDQAPSEQTAKVIRAVGVRKADLNALAAVVRGSMASPGWRPWMGPDPDAVTVEVDRRLRALILVGKKPRVDEAVGYIEALEQASARPDQVMESIALRHAQADRAAESLRRFFTERARSAGLPEDEVSIIGSPDGNVLIFSGDEASLTVMRDLVAQIDQPELGEDRTFEVYMLRNAQAAEAAETIRSMFPRSGRADEQVLVTPQPSTNTLIVSAPAEQFARVDALVRQLESPTGEASRIATVSLSSARAGEVAQAIRSALPPTVKVTITPVARNNTLLLTGSEEAIALVMEHVRALDREPVRSLQEFRLVRLKHAVASDVAFTLRQLLRGRPRAAGDAEPGIDYSSSDNTLAVLATADQLEEIAAIVEQIDVPSEARRTTEFVKLEFANAEQVGKALDVFFGPFAAAAATPAARAVRIVADPASNSLVVSADESEWEAVRALLKKLDTPEYDTSRQLAVIPLKYAEAASVARALNEGFRAPLEDRLRREQAQREAEARTRRGAADDVPFMPTVLVDSEGTPSVSADALTNSLIVFAGRKDQERVRAIVEQIDVPGFANLPEARVVTLESGRASTIAAALREIFQTQTDGARSAGPRALVIVGDDTSNSLIVRAEEREFAQIKAMAETLQKEGDRSKVTARILQLRNIPAARVQRTVLATFEATARARGETLAVEVDRDSNALVIASSRPLFEEIERLVREIDAIQPLNAAPPGEGTGVSTLGQSVTVVDVVHNEPAAVQRLLEQMGVTRPVADDRPGVVSEPVTIVPLTTRRAVAVLAGPQDARVIASLIQAIDAEPSPIAADQAVRVIPLKLATATRVVETLRAMLTPAPGDAPTPPARALVEHVRRLSVAGISADGKPIALDLAVPIRLMPDAQTNSVLIASSPSNVAAMEQVVRALDTLPVGDAVLIRVFPLENASAVRLRGVITELFTQGEALRRLPGTDRRGLPSTATGQALAGEIAVSIDDRTNTLIVAGREEAVALVEVLIKDLDSDEASNWIEPAVIALRHADAVTLATKLREVLVQGLSDTPEATALQRQIGRLRVLKAGGDPNDPSARIAADLFAPLVGLVISAEESLNALLVVGSPANVAAVRELASMLDVESASAANTVRVFPLRYAAADRIAGMVTDIFRQRESLAGAREEDRLTVVADARTNALVVSTSPRSFAVLEGLLGALDGEQANYAVGLHVIPVPGADVTKLAPKIMRLMRDRIDAAARQGQVRSAMDAFSIEPEPATSSLIVACSDENLRIIEDLVRALAEGGSGLADAERTELIPLSAIRATEAAQAIQELYVQKENAARGERAVSVLPNERLNALIVSGTAADIEAVRALVTQVDSARVTTVQQLRRIELSVANALEVKTLLDNLLAGRTLGGGLGLGQRQATRLQFIRQQIADDIDAPGAGPPTEAEIDGAIRDQVNIEAELRTNSIVIAAPPPMMALLEEVIRDLDTTDAGNRRIEKFRLINADARQMAEVLRDLFNLRQQGAALVLVPSRTQQEEEPEPGSGLSSTSVTPVPDERQQLSITIDARTNTLLVSGTAQYLDLVREVVTELDAIVATERDQKVYHLRNAKAPDVQRTMESYFRAESQRIRELLGPEQAGSLTRQLEQEVTVVGDEKSNKVLISASPRYINAVAQLVEELDASPPQVLIEVLLAEVTLDNEKSWGMDIRVPNFGGDMYNFTSLAGGSGVATSLGVPNLSIGSADFGLLIRALHAQGKLEVLSRPQITVNNNEQAIIKIGENVAIVSGVERLDSGNTRSDVERRDVGINLTVVPSISADGFVRMDIQPEISSVTARTTQISEDFQAPIISQRLIDTTITVKDGQSVVLGGLIQNQDETRKSRVPVLGSIPVIGLPFRSSKVTNVKTELLVILRPRIIAGAGEGLETFRRLTDEAIERLTDETEDRVRGKVEPGPIPAAGGDTGEPSTWPSEVGPYEPDAEPLPDRPGADGSSSAGEPPALVDIARPAPPRR